MKPSVLALVVIYGIAPAKSPAITSIGRISKNGINLRFRKPKHLRTDFDERAGEMSAHATL